MLGKQISYFGETVPQTIANPIVLDVTDKPTTYILSSTEFAFDANLIGFEIYGTASGLIRIYVC